MKISTEKKAELISEGKEARQLAYAPYSSYPVGAALLAGSGKVYTGANVENAAYPVSMCAERVALFQAVTSGDREFTAIAVVTENGGSPCGSCRQALSEFGLDTQVIMADAEGRIVQEKTLRELLPDAFTPEHLT
ncbi:MAG: cytidine deaminase [Anaerolineales bacterium]